jgi:hypothetical protein
MSQSVITVTDNKFLDYKKEELHTEVRTNTDLLTDEQRELIDFAINKAWINPKFKMKYFQAEEQLTPFHKLRQLMLELRACEESIEGVEYVIKKLPTEIDIVTIKMQRAEDDLEKKEWELKLIELERDLAQAKRRVAHNYIERHHYLDLIKEYDSDPENRTPDGKSLLTVFNTPLEDEYEKQYWIVRFAKQAAMDLLSYGNISGGNLSAITTLPNELQDEVYKIAHHYTAEMKQHQDMIRDEMAKQVEMQKKMVDGPKAKKDQNNRITNTSTEDGDLENVYSV